MACPGLPTKEVAVDIVCSAAHLNATLRMMGNAVQSDLHCASTLLPNAATKACGDTQGESSKIRRHLWSGKIRPGAHVGDRERQDLRKVFAVKLHDLFGTGLNM